jgi:hypothetical protein
VFPDFLPPYAVFAELQAVGGKDKDRETEKTRDKQKPPPSAAAQPPDRDLLTAAEPTGLEAPEGINPRMIGDYQGYFSLRRVLLGTTQTIQTYQVFTTTVTRQRVVIIDGEPTVITVQVPVKFRVPLATYQIQTLAPVVTRVASPFTGGYKIGDNQSPMPEDRVFLTYNYYNDLRGASGGAFSPHLDVQPWAVGGLPAIVTTVVPSPPPGDLHRQTFGFEKTFLDGSASFGIRVPIHQLEGDGSVGQQDLGDVSAILNYAFFRDPRTGNVLSGGLMATVPTGPGVDTVNGNIHGAILQPFGGGRWTFDRLYLQGFTSIAVPTDPRVVTAMFNDVAVGYWLYRGRGERFLSAVIPTLEAHVTTPLNHRGALDPIIVPDVVALTAGVHLGLSNRAMLTLGAAVPVTGPRIYPIEAVAQFNLRY